MAGFFIFVKVQEIYYKSKAWVPVNPPLILNSLNLDKAE
jgi:hypothetical protein